MSYRRPFWEEREGVWETHWRLSQTVQAKMLIFSQEASAEVLAGRGKGSSEILFYTAVLNIVSTYISKFPPQSHVVSSHTHAQAQLCPHVLLNSHTCILPLTFTHSHCPSHSHLCSTALPILYQQRCLNPIEIKNSFENSPFKKKKFNSKQMDCGLDIYILRGFHCNKIYQCFSFYAEPFISVWNTVPFSKFG